MSDGHAFELRILSETHDLRLDPDEKENPIFQESNFPFIRFPPHQPKGEVKPKGAPDGATQNVFTGFQIAKGVWCSPGSEESRVFQ